MFDQFLNDEAQSAKLPSAVTRRGFATLSAAGAVAVCAGAAKAAPLTLTESRTSVATPHGAADAWLVHPASGRHPGVVMWPDAAGLRGSTLAVARQLAGQGFAVMVVDRTYHGADLSGIEAHRRANRDAKAFVAVLNRHDAVQPAAAKSGSLGNGYSLRSISAAHSRLSLASRAERIAAAQSGLLVAVPDALVARVPAKMDKLSEAARLAFRAAA